MTYSFRDVSRRTVRLLGIVALGLFGLNAYIALTRTAPATAEPLAFFHGEMIPGLDASNRYLVEIEIDTEIETRSDCPSARHERVIIQQQRDVERHRHRIEREQERVVRQRERVMREVERRVERIQRDAASGGQAQTATIVRVR